MGVKWSSKSARGDDTTADAGAAPNSRGGDERGQPSPSAPRDAGVPEEWAAEQKDIRDSIITEDHSIRQGHAGLDSLLANATETAPRLLAGCDISFIKGNDVDALAALVILNYPQLKVVYSTYRMVKLEEPYVSGYLAFREARHIVDLVSDMRKQRPDLKPDCLLVDGNGLLHPRGCGLACHLGVLLDMVTIGIGKNLMHMDGLTKERVKALMTKDASSGADTVQRVNLVGDSGVTHGAAIAIAGVSKPIFVSIGHKISLDTAVDVVIRSSIHRIPEPVRQADLTSREMLRKLSPDAVIKRSREKQNRP